MIMILKTIVEEMDRKSIKAWADEYRIVNRHGDRADIVNEFGGFNDADENSTLHILTDKKDHVWNPPMHNNWWGAGFINFANDFSYDRGNHVFENFEKLPNTLVLKFNQSKIKSLEGVEKLYGLHELNLSGDDDSDISCGLLRLLKIPCKIGKVHIDNPDFALGKKLTQALSIMKEHEDNMPELIDALMEAGLKEYAKR